MFFEPLQNDHNLFAAVLIRVLSFTDFFEYLKLKDALIDLFLNLNLIINKSTRVKGKVMF